MESLNKLLEVNLKIASDMLIKTGSLAPMFVLLSPKDELTLIVTPWDSDDTKDVLVSAVQAKMEQDGTVAYVHMAEAWMAVVDLKTQPELMKLAPSKRNDRKEVIIVTANDHLDTKCGMLEIVRDDKGKVIGTKPSDMPKDIEIGGRMTELLR